MKYVIVLTNIGLQFTLYWDGFSGNGYEIRLTTDEELAFEFSEYAGAQNMADFLNENTDGDFEVRASP